MIYQALTMPGNVFLASWATEDIYFIADIT